MTSSSASVSGTVNPNGTVTSYAFQYGNSTGYGEQTSSQSAGSSNSSQNVTATLNGLPSGTTIHFRLIATYGSNSTVVGSDATFTTSGPPPTVPAPTATTGAATSVSAHGAQLNGTVGATTEGTSYYFQYGTSANYGVETSPGTLSAGTSSQAVKATLSSLQAGVVYHYRLVTRSSSGLTSTGADQTFSTTLSATPSVTTGSASSITSSSARLSGTVNPEGSSTSYAFQYATSTSYGAQTSSQSAGSGTSQQSVSETLTGLPSGTTIHYRIIAIYGSNSIVVGNDATLKTSGAPARGFSPAATTGSATSLGSHSVQLNGSVAPTGAGASYYFQYGLNTYYGLQTIPAGLTASSSTQAVKRALSGLQSGVTYHYRLVARSSSGLIATGLDRSFRTSVSAPRRPRSLTLTATSAIGRVHVIINAGGTLRLPAGVSPRTSCSGSVSVQIKTGTLTVSNRTTALSRTCHYHERTVLTISRLQGRSQLHAIARFQGNARLQPITSGTATVRA